MAFFGDGGASGQGGSGAGGFAESAVCGGEAHGHEAVPVDMLIMFDQSSSMSDPLPDGSGTWWATAQTALSSFVGNSRAGGMAVGIQYFPLSGSAPACVTRSPLGDCCTPAVYEKPEVEVGALPANSAALATSIQSHSPTTFTPTSAALEGALDHMKAWAPGHPGRAPVVVLVTDGFPTECGTPLSQGADIVDIAALAKTAVETEPKVRTFVVGFNLGDFGTNLNQIAKAGGTNKAFLIDKGDIGAAFINAMLSIVNTPIDCAFDIPKPTDPKEKLDPALVDVRYTPSATGVTEHVPKLNNLGECDANGGKGWYYDSPAQPTKILTCPGTCSSFAAGVVETINGCSPTSQIAK